MKNAITLLTEIIKTEVFGAPFSPFTLSTEEAIELFRLAKRHELTPIVGNAVCRKEVDADERVKDLFEKESFIALYNYEMMTKELETLSSLFESAQIPFMPLKGAVLRGYYPAPWMRTSGDVDILVHKADHERAKQIFLANGYRFEHENDCHANFVSPSGILFELHSRLFRKETLPLAAKLLEDPWAHAHPVRDGGYLHALSDDVFYLYHVAHLAKHYLNGGCGIRFFLDLWILEQRLPKASPLRDSMLADAGLLAFAKHAKALCGVWFHGDTHSQTTKEMESYLLSGGVYGSPETNVSVRYAKRGRKRRYIFNRIFLPYKALKSVYPVLEKKKWLFPFLQVRRWCRLIFCGGGIRAIRRLYQKSVIGSGTRRETLEHLKNLGF